MTDDVTVAIPTIPPRRDDLLPLAIRSALVQSHMIAALSVAVDTDHLGAWHTRQRALDAVRTEWVAFLDDDDQLYPNHVERLLAHAHETGADYVFSYFDTTKTPDVLGLFGRPFDPADPTHTTMTVLVRTELAQQIHFTPREPEHYVGGEDWRFTLGCVAAGAKIVHLPEQTWFWSHHGGNTSGREDRW
jgi:hypothetical protein